MSYEELVEIFNQAAGLAREEKQEEALEFLHKIIPDLKDLDNYSHIPFDFLFEVQLRKAYCLMDLEQFEKAKELLGQKELTPLMQQASTTQQYELYYALGNIYGNLTKLRECQKHLMQAYIIAFESLIAQNKIYNTMNSLMYWSHKSADWQYLETIATKARDVALQSRDLLLRLKAEEYMFHAKKGTGKLVEALLSANCVLYNYKKYELDAQIIAKWEKIISEINPDGPFASPLCHSPWFNPDNPNDLRVTNFSENCSPIEVDSIAALQYVMTDFFAPNNGFVIYQQWGEEQEDGSRLFFWLDCKTVKLIADIIKGGPTKKLVLLCTTFEPGAIKLLAELLGDDTSSQLEYLGMFWYFSGDDITDAPDIIAEINYAVDRLQLQSLSILTEEFDDRCKNLLFEGLKDNRSLLKFGVYRKNDAQTWPAFPTAKIDEIIKSNRRKNER
ncbi:hypothetical protein ACFL35_15185 [Candidatus Riflebacteria bacterium]